MNSKKLMMTSLVVGLAIAAITVVLSISQTPQSTAQVAPVIPPQGNNIYLFAEGSNPQATFHFAEGTETSDFQLYDMTTGIFGTASTTSIPMRLRDAEFTLARTVGNTPLLHNAVTQTYLNGGQMSITDFPNKMFDVSVSVVQAGGEIKLRTIDYQGCSITNYKINTRTDNEEGYTTGGKTGFAVVETYTFVCKSFALQSPDYDSMIKEANKSPFEK